MENKVVAYMLLKENGTIINEKTCRFNDFYKEAAKQMAEVDTTLLPLVARFVVDKAVAEYQLRMRSGTLFITELSNTLPPEALIRPDKARFLTCVNPEKNSYKFYRMDVPSGGKFTATYGRMGVAKGELFGERSCSWEEDMFWPKYFEKISKGYVDRSDVFLGASKNASGKTQEPVPAPNTTEGRLFERLLSCSRQIVHEASVSVPISERVINETERLVEKLRGAADLFFSMKEQILAASGSSDAAHGVLVAIERAQTDAFNKVLLDLVATLQRPVPTGNGSGVRDLLAQNANDFKRIVQREDTLLNAMKGVLLGGKGAARGFHEFGLTVKPAGKAGEKTVMDMLSRDHRRRVSAIYEVSCKWEEERLQKYLERRGLKSTKLLFHGSAAENWLSLMAYGPKLDPNARTCGKALGYGIYAAPDSEKSINYAGRGRDGKRYVGVFETAYNPWDVTGHIRHYTEKEVNAHGKDCVLSRASGAYTRDEVCFYNEGAMVLRYLIEID